MNSLIKTILPGQTIGIIGGGQLGQMLAQSAKEMGYKVGILDPTENCSAAQVSDFHIQAEFEDLAAIKELANRCDVITFEFENIDTDVLDNLKKHLYLPQETSLLKASQNRLSEKAFLKACGVELAPYRPVHTREELQSAFEELGYPAVLKTIRFGYDGKGQKVLHSPSDIEACQVLLDQQTCVLEKWIPFKMELSVMMVGNPTGEYVSFPASENIHWHNILHESIVPARISEKVAKKAQEVAHQIAKEAHLVGTLGIEMFLTKDDQILINELAPRPHNSGHYTIEACDFSQFDLHIRAICNLPLSQPILLKPAVMVNILGQHVKGVEEAVDDHPEWHLHFYGKDQAKVNRKMGHITYLTSSIEQTLKDIESSHIWVKE